LYLQVIIYIHKDFNIDQEQSRTMRGDEKKNIPMTEIKVGVGGPSAHYLMSRVER
jgi:hypothetical protein